MVKQNLRLIINFPPRHGKSDLTSKWFPVWYLRQRPEHRVMLATYEAGFSASWGRKVRDTIDQYKDFIGVSISENSAAADFWETDQGGGMKTAGVGGPLTGFGCDVLCIDDPVKNAEEAASETYRDKVWDWWTSTASTRLEPGANVIIIQTRWHEDDLTGRLLARDKELIADGEQPEGWIEYVFPAVAENLGSTDGVPNKDALERVDGDALWPDRYPIEVLRRIERRVGALVWGSLYQQRPAPLDGTAFQRSWIVPYRYTIQRQNNSDPDSDRVILLPRTPGLTAFDKSMFTSFAVSEMETFLVSDTAMTLKKESDPTCIGVFWKSPRRHMILKEMFHGRLTAPDVEKKILEMYRRNRCLFMAVESKNGGLVAIQRFLDLDLYVKPLKAITDKLTRSAALQIMMEQGKVWHPAPGHGMPEVYWDTLVDEFVKFPRGTHDDIVDVYSYAAMLMTEYTYDTDGEAVVYDAEFEGDPSGRRFLGKQYPSDLIPGYRVPMDQRDGMVVPDMARDD